MGSRTETTPLGDRSLSQVTDENLALVMDAFAAHDVPAFVVRTRSLTRRCVAVYAEHRDRAVQALAASLGGGDVHVRWLGSGPRPARPVGKLADRQGGVGAQVLQVGRFFITDGGELEVGLDRACEVEFWEPDPDRDGVRRAPRPNVLSTAITESALAELGTVEVGGRAHPTPVAFTRPVLEDIDFPVDVVYYWVDGDDPAWQRKRQQWDPSAGGEEELHASATAAARFHSRDELKYSLRSLQMYAPWVRTVYLVTDDQLPDWLDPEAAGIQVISHTELLAGAALPTFNSRVISSCVHRIEGLSEQFLCINDDVFIGRPVAPQRFFTPAGQVRTFSGDAHRLFGEPSSQWTPQANTAIRIRRLLERDYGVTVSRGMRHVPVPLLRSGLAALEERYPEEYERTRQHRFRDGNHIDPVQLFHHWAQITGVGVAGSLATRYVNVGDHEQVSRLDDLLEQRDCDAFCLNDTIVGEKPMPDEQVQDFMAAYFPIPSSFERRSSLTG